MKNSDRYFTRRSPRFLVTLSLNDRPSRFIVMLLTNPHLLEGAEGCQDRSPKPSRAFALWGCNDFDNLSRSQDRNFFLKTLSKIWKHCRTTGEDNVCKQFFLQV